MKDRQRIFAQFCVSILFAIGGVYILFYAIDFITVKDYTAFLKLPLELGTFVLGVSLMVIVLAGREMAEAIADAILPIDVEKVWEDLPLGIKWEVFVAAQTKTRLIELSEHQMTQALKFKACNQFDLVVKRKTNKVKLSRSILRMALDQKPSEPPRLPVAEAPAKTGLALVKAPMLLEPTSSHQ